MGLHIIAMMSRVQDVDRLRAGATEKARGTVRLLESRYAREAGGAGMTVLTPIEHEYDREALQLLATELLRGALRDEGPEYVSGPCGRWWVETTGLEPAVVWATAVKGTALGGGGYRPARRCATCSG